MELNSALVFVIYAVFISPTWCVRTEFPKIPESPIIAIEGEKKVMHCILEATELPAPSSYANLWSQDAEGNYAIVKSAERITVSEFTRGLQAIKMVEFHPYNISDVGDDGFYCGTGNYPTGMHAPAYILPKNAVPKLNFTSNIPNKYGAKASFICKAELSGAKIGLNMKWLYYKKKRDAGQDVTSKASKPKKGGTSPVKTIESTLSVDIKGETAGTYECLIQATVKNTLDFNFTRNASVAVPVRLMSGVNPKQKLKVYQKKDATMICKAFSIPPATVTWKKGNTQIKAMSDDRYHFSNYDSTRNAKFVIKSVDYKDRAVYTCNASNGISFVTMEFTLRVRDPLGALWPFIGIVIEAIVLAVIIVAYEQYRKKHPKKMKKAQKEKETSPLLSATQEPGVAYTVGGKRTDEGVKLIPSDARI